MFMWKLNFMLHGLPTENFTAKAFLVVEKASNFVHDFAIETELISFGATEKFEEELNVPSRKTNQVVSGS